LDEAGKVYPQIKKVNIEWMPLPNYTITEVDSMADLVTSVQVLTEELNSLRNQLKRYLISKFQMVKVSSNIENWQELGFGEFINELNKAINATNKQHKKEGKQSIKILTKTDEFEWQDLFEQNKKKAQELQFQINTIEQQIDAMVYELYGLSNEEIKIIENA
jgi:polyhydroxyalkanoate synthesis regulator phasin